jgi:20S proteasome alpha/beta subunit
MMATQRGTERNRFAPLAKFFEKRIFTVSPSGSIFCEDCSAAGSSNSNVFNILRNQAEKTGQASKLDFILDFPLSE